MAEGEGIGTSSQSATGTGTASHLPWHLIPSIDPSETDLTEYTRRLEFLAGIWPSEHLSQTGSSSRVAVQRVCIPEGYQDQARQAQGQ